MENPTALHKKRFLYIISLQYLPYDINYGRIRPLVLWLGPWVERALGLKEKQGRIKDFFFCTEDGRRRSLKNLEGGILDRVARVQRNYLFLIRATVDVHEEYGLSRSFRRGSTSEALNRGVSDSEVDRNNRWRKEERAGVRKAKLRMWGHYSKVLVSLEAYLKYSQAL